MTEISEPRDPRSPDRTIAVLEGARPLEEMQPLISCCPNQIRSEKNTDIKMPSVFRYPSSASQLTWILRCSATPHWHRAELEKGKEWFRNHTSFHDGFVTYINSFSADNIQEERRPKQKVHKFTKNRILTF